MLTILIYNKAMNARLIAQGIERGGNGFAQPTTTSSSSSGGANSTGIETNPFGTGAESQIDPLNGINTGGLTTPIAGDLTIAELIQMVIVYAFIAAAALSAIFIFVGGINFILSGGNDEKIKKAVNTIRYAIIGLIITILSFTFVTIIGRIFGLNFLDYISYDSIRASLDKIIQSSQTESSGGGFNPQ